MLTRERLLAQPFSSRRHDADGCSICVASYTKDTLLSVLRVFTRNVADIDNPFVAQAPLSTQPLEAC